MNDELPTSALATFLKSNSPLLYGKSVELRRCVLKWLEYIPASFPHYTQHTIEHSDEIIVQISKVLGGTPTGRFELDLSSVEAYILIASAYLHDVGMVVSDADKMEILRSPDWNEWTTAGSGKKRWDEIRSLQNSNDPLNADDHFLVNVQTRFLVAEFIRRTHHLRSAKIIIDEEAALGRFALNDAILIRSISDVCAGHGLRHHELEDETRFPTDTDVLSEAVNVRLMAILLRLGDLLDLRTDRACPLLMNAACPLPPDSSAHWSQFDRFTQRVTRPDRIRITAVCNTQEEHRIIRDWCQWIENEIEGSRKLAAKFRRHGGWKPPEATLFGPSPTLLIGPSSSAKYVWRDWKFELDNEAVFQRLVNDVYDSPLAFVRELIQNALDAMRCSLFVDLAEKGDGVPSSPTELPLEMRRRYKLSITLVTRRTKNDLSGEMENRQVLTVEDTGIGMDEEIIGRYFLQIGRSYYTSPEFREQYRFVASSRFGLGFLSVFAVSDRVIVETYRPSQSITNNSIRLILTGPRNYLITERGELRERGTRIEVELRKPLNQGELTTYVRTHCRRVEFPIEVDELGKKVVIEAESERQFVYERPDLSDSDGRFVVRGFPINRPGIEGNLFVFARVTAKGESWAAHHALVRQFVSVPSPVGNSSIFPH